MGASLDRANAIVGVLEAAGVRATTDPSAVNPPCVLVLPPDRRYDVGCGWTAAWTLVALAPAAQGADHTTWGLLEGLVDGAAGAVGLDVLDAGLAVYTLNGVTYPSYLIHVEELL